jgi:NitT/TauT family transport system substrate-binding protein
MRNLTRRTFVKIAGVAAITTVAGSLVSCTSSDRTDADTETQEVEGDSNENAFMSEGKGEHLICAVTGKLIKIAPAILADQLGYFEEEGCDVEFQTVALADAMASMSVNKLDIDLFGIVPACSYVSQGVEIYVFGGTILNGSEIISTTAFTRELKTADDFRGLNIACSREESGQIFLKNYLSENGLELGADVEFEYVDNATTALEGLRSGQNDLFIQNNAMGYTYSSTMDDIKVAAIVADVTGSYPCCRQNCSEEAYHSKFLSLVDFEIALMRGYDYYLNNKEDVISRLVEYSAQEPDYVEAALYGTATYRNVMDLSPDPHTREIVQFYEAMQNIGEIEKSGYDMSDYATSAVYKKALDTLAEREPANATYKKLMEDFSRNNA